MAINVTISGGSSWDSVSGKPTAAAENSFMVSGASPYRWLVKTLAQVKTILGLGSAAYTNTDAYAAAGHNHDSAYAATNHNHDSAYAASNHNHSGVYAPVSHTQSATTITPDAVQAAAYANPLALDATTHKDFKCASVTGNTVVNLSNEANGDAGIIELIIDGTGGYTVTLGTMFTKNSGGGTIDVTANADNIIAWYKSGTDIIYSISQVS